MQNDAHMHSVTVGATDSEDKMSTFSNYGKCVDIFAPVSQKLDNIALGKLNKILHLTQGSSVTSTWKGDGVNTISGS